MSVWALGVCQSRNWEAFSVDLWGQGLPKAPLQNNSRPGSWQWDSGGRCSAKPALKTDRLPPPPFLSRAIHKDETLQPSETGGGREQQRSDHLADMICLECDNTLLYVNRHVRDVRYNNGQMGGFSQQQLDPDLRTGIHLFTLQYVPCVQSKVHMYMINLNDVVLWVCQQWKSQRSVPIYEEPGKGEVRKQTQDFLSFVKLRRRN